MATKPSMLYESNNALVSISENYGRAPFTEDFNNPYLLSHKVDMSSLEIASNENVLNLFEEQYFNDFHVSTKKQIERRQEVKEYSLN